MTLVTNNAGRLVHRSTDVVYVTAPMMQIIELLSIGNCDVLEDGENITLRPEGMPSITLTVPARTVSQLINRNLIEQYSNSAQLTHGTGIAV